MPVHPAMVAMLPCLVAPPLHRCPISRAPPPLPEQTAIAKRLPAKLFACDFPPAPPPEEPEQAQPDVDCQSLDEVGPLCIFSWQTLLIAVLPACLHSGVAWCTTLSAPSKRKRRSHLCRRCSALLCDVAAALAHPAAPCRAPARAPTAACGA